jgi:hypothetical protein
LYFHAIAGGERFKTRVIGTPNPGCTAKCPTLDRITEKCNQQPCYQPQPTLPPCSGSNCPTKPPPTPPPACVDAKPTFDVEPTFYKYTRFDSTKLSASGFAIKFEIKGCQGAALAFMTAQADSASRNAYEVRIGSWDGGQSSIGTSTGSTLVSVSHTPLPKPCEQFMPFWIQLKAGQLSVGSGTVMGDNSFLSTLVPPIAGDGCDCLFVGFSANDVKLSYRYAPPMRNCGGDQCVAAASPSTTTAAPTAAAVTAAPTTAAPTTAAPTTAAPTTAAPTTAAPTTAAPTATPAQFIELASPEDDQAAEQQPQKKGADDQEEEEDEEAPSTLAAPEVNVKASVQPAQETRGDL